MSRRKPTFREELWNVLQESSTAISEDYLKKKYFFTGYIVSSCMVAHFTTFLARNRERRNGSILIVLFIMGPGHEGLKN